MKKLVEVYERPEKEDYINWKNDRVTRFFLQQLVAKREEGKEEWANGKFTDRDILIASGKAQGIQDCIDYALLDFEYIEVEKQEN
jgi:hypothetical protein